MSNVIQTAYSGATSVFKAHAAEILGTSPENIRRKRVPDITKKDPVSGQPTQIKWEPEDSELFASDDGLFAFPEIVRSIPGMFIAPDLGLDFQTATIALVPINPDSALNAYMARMRFDAVPNPNASRPWKKRLIRDVTFGIKDSGKAIDRMELETDRRQNDMRLHNALRGFRKEHKLRLADKPALFNMRKTQLTAGALTAMSRTAFFGMHFHADSGVFVDHQFSMDYCRNSRPKMLDEDGKIVIDGLRREGEGESFGTYSARKLHPQEREEIITASLNQCWAHIRAATKALKIPTIPTEMNKAEFARHQVDQAYGIEKAIGDKVTTVDYANQPLRRRWIALFDGDAEHDIEAMITPTQIRQRTGLLLPAAEAA